LMVVVELMAGSYVVEPASRRAQALASLRDPLTPAEAEAAVTGTAFRD
jgi:hypothetical protein